MDFGALPPEINSGRMYAGPGPGSMLAAAAAWDGLAADLHSASASYQSVISGLTVGRWQGPASVSMAAAAAPFATWMNTIAAQCEQAAVQAKAAVAAYETAFAMTVPPPVIAANRAQLMALVATNFLGQNTPAIMATEAHYAEMWAQDAAAMYGYAGSSAAASTLTPFPPPQQTTNPAGTASQAAAVAQAAGTSAGTHTHATLSQLTAAVPATLQQLASPSSATPSTSGMVMGNGASMAASMAYSPVSALTALDNAPGKGAVKTAKASTAAGSGALAGVSSFLGSPAGVAAGVGSGVGADVGGVTADVGGLGMDFFGVGLDYSGVQTLSEGAGGLGALGGLGPLGLGAGEGLGSLGGLGAGGGLPPLGGLGGLGGLSATGASASLGQAASVGALSVPAGWTQAVPVGTMPVGTMSPATATAAPLGHLGVRPPVSTVGSTMPKMPVPSVVDHAADDLVQRIGMRPAMVPHAPLVG